MIRARVTISQKVKLTKTIEVEANSYHELYQTARAEASMCLADDYDEWVDFDDYENENLEILEEDTEEEE